MRLASLLEGIAERVSVVGNPEMDLQAVCVHSGEARAGSLFIAIRGFRNDGHAFIAEAVKNGAVAVAGDDEERLKAFQGRVVTVLSADSRVFAARCAAEFYGHPSRNLKLVGITGTNGKTTTCYLTDAIFRAADLKTALLGTVETRIGEDSSSSVMTTPEPIQLQRFLSKARGSGVTHAVMEVSSHAIAFSRTLGCEFDVVALTNVTQDHLDFHSSFEGYVQTKLRLFTDYVRETAKEVSGVVNADDLMGEHFKRHASCPVVTCGNAAGADLRILEVTTTASGTRVEVDTREGRQELSFPLYGAFNVTNAVMAAAIARAARIPWGTIESALAVAKPPAGRLERIDEGQPFLVFVDYAHTPDSLGRALEAVRGLCRGRLIVVFGCGGDRDKGKRPLMGQIAASAADLAIVTSDNPRSEEPEHIIDEILSGMGRGAPLVEPDRDKAIGVALAEAREQDAVLIAGKGHETYQIFKDRTIHFSDQEVARRWLREALDGKHSR